MEVVLTVLHPNGRVKLRKEKISMNRLIRWCSCGLLTAFISLIVSAIPVVNDLSPKMWWLSYLLPALLIVLVIALILLEYCYAEKREDTLLREANYYISKEPALNNLNLKNIVYLTAVTLTFLLAGFSAVRQNYLGSWLAFTAGLIIYLTGLLLLRHLLKKKRFIRRLLDHPSVRLSLA